MKKVFKIILILVIFGCLFVSYKYTIIRKGLSFYFMKKNPPTFEEVYIDVTNWTFKDYALHPKISAFLVAKGIKKKSTKIKYKVMETIEKQKKEMEKMIEKKEE